MKIIEKIKQMPVKVKLASAFLMSLFLVMLYFAPLVAMAIAIGMGSFYAILTIIEYFY